MRHFPSRFFLLPLLTLGLPFVSDARAQIRVLERAQHAAVSGYASTPANSAYYDRSRGVAVFHGIGTTNETWEWSGTGAVARSSNTQQLSAMCGFPGRPGQSLGFRAVGATLAVRNLGQWTALPSTGPTYNPNLSGAEANLALDEARGRAVLVYAQNVGLWQQPTRATWEFDGQTWTLIPTNTPANGVMLYNPARQCVQLVGGIGNVLEWNGTSWTTWTSGPRPTHVLECAAFDRDRNRLVVGGWDNVSFTKYVHEFDGAQWTQLWAETAYPPLRLFGAMVYDEVRRTTLVSGLAFPGTREVLWTWNGSQLAEVTASTARPQPRNDAMLAEDSTRGAILFGGRDGNNVPNAETWLWDGDTWTDLNLPVAPSPRSAAAMTRAGNGRVFLFGGYSAAGTALGDTWELLPYYGWSPIQTAGSMPARWNHAMACDLGAAGRVYLFGGTDGQNWFADLRRFDASTFPASWVVVPAGNGPSARDLHAMATDEVRRKLVLFGGRNAAQSLLADTWEFDLNSQTWSQRLPFHVPPMRGNHALVCDRSRQRTLLFGGSGPAGNFYDDVWEWDGTDWTRRTLETRSIAATENPAACFDGRTQRTVVFGGQSAGASDATYEIVEPSGPVALRQQAPLAMTVTSLPVAFAGQCTPLGVRIPSSGGLSALFLGFGQAPTPYAIGQAPLFCSQQDLHVQGLVSYLGFGSVANYTVPIPTIAVGLLLSFQGVALTASGCVDATDARFAFVRSTN